ncbi:MAG: hypothetical protein ACJ72J_01430 [Nitrososphaeraceae archaeon]
MTNYFEVNDDHLCGAVNCFEKPTMEIKLKVGQKQTITLHVCAKCVDKFGIKPQQTGIRVAVLKALIIPIMYQQLKNQTGLLPN